MLNLQNLIIPNSVLAFLSYTKGQNGLKFINSTKIPQVTFWKRGSNIYCLFSITVHL